MKINNIAEIKNIKIHVLTPLYIGNGDEFDITKFWIDMEKNELIEFFPDDFISKLSSEQKKQLDSWCTNTDKNSLRNIMMLAEQVKPEGRIKKVSREIVHKYRDILDGRPDFNRFGIKKTVSDINTGNVYIPGSSLKGTLRTAYLDSFKDVHFSDREIKEDIYLGRMHENIFASLKVSDFVTLKSDTTIYNIDRVSKKKDIRTNSYKHMVVTMAETVNPGSVFEGSIAFLSYIKTKIKFTDFEEILKKTDLFFRNILKDTANGINYPDITEIENIQNGFKNKTFLCRLGGLIGAESHTIAPRRIKIMLGRGRPPASREHTTRLLYVTPDIKKSDNNNIGLGWCLIEIAEDTTPVNNTALNEFIENQKKILNAFEKNNRSNNKYNSNNNKSYNNSGNFGNNIRITKLK